MSYKVIGVTANCGNSTIGNDATNAIAALCTEEADLVVINLQEANFYKIEGQLRNALRGKNIGVATSKFMTTITKPTEIFGRTGMGSIVLFNKRTIEDVNLDCNKTNEEVRGDNRNKGGLLSTFKIKLKQGKEFSLRAVTGHLDSNNEKRRCKDWVNITKNNAFDINGWDDLVIKTPVMQVSGYDANTRNLWFGEAKPTSNPWHKGDNGLTSPIEFMVQSPLGNHLYSQDNTYKTAQTSGLPPKQDKNRPKYAKAGSLDFVALQNNSSTKINEPKCKYFHESTKFLPPPGKDTARDHSVIISSPSELVEVSDFEKVRNHLANQLSACAPNLSAEIAKLDENKENKDILCKVHKLYLSKNGKIVKTLNQLDPTEEKKNIIPWFELSSLKSLDLDLLFWETKKLSATLSSLRKELGWWIFNWHRIATFDKNLQVCMNAVEAYEIAAQSIPKSDADVSYKYEAVKDAVNKLYSKKEPPILQNFLQKFEELHSAVVATKAPFSDQELSDDGLTVSPEEGTPENSPENTPRGPAPI